MIYQFLGITQLVFASLLLAQTSIAKTCRGEADPKSELPTVLREYHRNNGLVKDEYLKTAGVARYIQIPKSPYEIYFKNGDFPFEEIKVHAEKSQDFWQEIPKEWITYFNSRNFDWITFQELNLRTHKLWANLLKCNHNDGTAMRKRFFTGELCEDLGSATELQKQVNKLSLDLVVYLTTSSKIDISDIKIPFQHPLLQQLALQAYSVSEVTSFDLPKLHSFLGFRISITPPSPSTRILDEQQRNNLAAVIFSEIQKCSALGLWPAMNRAFMRPAQSLPPDSIYSLSLSAMANSEKVCGVHVESYSNDSFSRFSYAHIRQMRRLFTQYYPLQYLTPELKKLSEDLKLDIELDLKCVK